MKYPKPLAGKPPRPSTQSRSHAVARPSVAAAPPVYRPQPTPVVLQRKAAAGQPPDAQAKPAPGVLQRKTAGGQQAPAAGQRRPAAPPVYRPQPAPKVLQAKKLPAHQPAQPPARRPPPAATPRTVAPRVVQAKLSQPDALTLFMYWRDKYADSGLSMDELQKIHRKHVLGCTSLSDAKQLLDKDVATLAGPGSGPSSAPHRTPRDFIWNEEEGSVTVVFDGPPQPVLTQPAQQQPAQQQPSSWALMVGSSASPGITPAPKKKAGPTLDELRAQILSDGSLREAAESYLRLNPSISAEQTVCMMWMRDGSMRKRSSGGRLSKQQRQAIGASTVKETTCAEENLFARYGTRGWVFSLAYDSQNGWKSACQAGCSALLKSYNIEDLARQMIAIHGRK